MTTYHLDSRRDPVAALERRTLGLSPWWLVAPTLLVLLVWPMQTLVAGLLIATVLVLAGIYTLWMERHPVPPVKRHRFDANMRYALVALVGVGILFAVAFPTQMAIATFVLAIAASGTWILVDFLLRHPRAAEESVATDEPGFWAEPSPTAAIGPEPEPDIRVLATPEAPRHVATAGAAFAAPRRTRPRRAVAAQARHSGPRRRSPGVDARSAPTRV